ncbi:WXG100 family type VII secretion target [Streptomyces smyrnaeus]|uniref:WXG100 family type VII secretion target n=1 Tax=Streptomyces TaxID=1883 RepID=UPI000C17E0E5|nr:MULTISPECIES: WXG100 family type VII secretion target [unclassified Streptomyces]MBQ0868390.1 WXG100 family type VII secretion target [Streptomyces sp. RK75]MBQ1123515.1 WXG100 family type VII secretion target [Streptomyces sp. B15]MBQ1158867.1 WXG100 family type VII secretion target [Streptomyces sp. A73]
MPKGYQDGLKVTYASLDEAATSIEGFAKTLMEDLGDIRKQVASISEAWEGEAQTAYKEAMRKWDTKSQAVQQALTEIVRVIRLGRDGYQETDLASARWFHPNG